MIFTFLHLTTKRTKRKEKQCASSGTVEIEEEEEVVQDVVWRREKVASEKREWGRLWGNRDVLFSFGLIVTCLIVRDSWSVSQML